MNVLVLAHRRDHEHHDLVRSWFEDEVNSARPFALADVAIAGFVRVVTHPRVYVEPTPLRTAIEFVDGLFERPNCLPASAGPHHWQILRELLEAADARANLVPDAHLAAIAIEHGATIATRDRGFARFPGVRSLDPVTNG